MSFRPPLKDNRIAEMWSKRARATGLEAYRRIVKRTPVREGTAKANWHITIGKASDWVDMEKTTVDMNPPMDAKQAAKFLPIFIQNNVPYIGPLEYGHSKKSAQGMVRVTMVELGAKS